MAGHLTKAEAASKGWYCLKDLKEQFRLKPATGQQPAGSVWQGKDHTRSMTRCCVSP